MPIVNINADENGDITVTPADPEGIDINAIRARLDAATRGPWTAHPDGLVWSELIGDPVSGSTEVADAKFIAAARTDVPALLAEVEKLRSWLAREDRAHEDTTIERDHLRAIIAAVKMLTVSTDGDPCGHDEQIPIGEIVRVLAEGGES